MSDLNSLLARARRVAPAGHLPAWQHVLLTAFNQSRFFDTPEDLKTFCTFHSLNYSEMLFQVKILPSGKSRLSIPELLERGEDTLAYELAYIDCPSYEGVSRVDVFPVLDEWGIEVASDG